MNCWFLLQYGWTLRQKMSDIIGSLRAVLVVWNVKRNLTYKDSIDWQWSKAPREDKKADAEEHWPASLNDNHVPRAEWPDNSLSVLRNSKSHFPVATVSHFKILHLAIWRLWVDLDLEEIVSSWRATQHKWQLFLFLGICFSFINRKKKPGLSQWKHFTFHSNYYLWKDLAYIWVPILIQVKNKNKFSKHVVLVLCADH